MPWPLRPKVNDIMMKKRSILILLLMTILSVNVLAQNDPYRSTGGNETNDDDMDSPTFVPTIKVGRVLDTNHKDTIPYVELHPVYVSPQLVFKSEEQRMSFNRLVRNVKKVLPIAKEVNSIILETYEYLETLPNKKARDEHMKRVEKGIKQQYTPQMKKLTYSQGKLLIKLVNRECSSTSYELVQAFLGPVKAGFYQAFAAIFGASLRKGYDPEGTDRLTERVVLMVEAGQL